MAFTVGPNTFLAAIETAGATSLNISGGRACRQARAGVVSGGGGGGSNASVGATGFGAPGSATYNGMLVARGQHGRRVRLAVGIGADRSQRASACNANVLSSTLPDGRRHGRQSGSHGGRHERDQCAGRAGRNGRRADAYHRREHRRKPDQHHSGRRFSPINISSATTTQLVAAASGKTIYVTAWDVIAAGTTNMTLEYGTGSNCGTGTRRSPAPMLHGSIGAAPGNGLGPVLVVPAGNALCALTSAAVQMSGSLSYTQF